MEQYCVYNSPSDFPGLYVVRRWVIENGVMTPEADPCMMSKNLEWVRWFLSSAGLVCVTRRKEDNPVIVETWL